MLKANPAYRRRVLRLSAAVLAAGVVLGVVVVQWGLPALARHLDRQRPDDAIRFLKTLYIAMMLPPLAFFLHCFRVARQIQQCGEYPLPGSSAIRDTPIVRGRAASRRAHALMACSGAGVAAVGASVVLVAYVFR